VPDAGAQVVEQRDRPAEQQQIAEPAADPALHVGEVVGPAGRGDDPPDQDQAADDERDTGDPVQDRQHGGQLRAVDLQVRG
jgi:hypothetical protein